MFKRLTWFGIGAAAGASGVVWAQQKVRRQLDALGPDHIVVTAGNQARKVSRQVGRTVAGAVVEGRSAMREREDELVARRDGRRGPVRDQHRWPARRADVWDDGSDVQAGDDDRSTGTSRKDGRAERPTRPARW